MVYLRRCPKCNGDLAKERDRYGEYVQCLQCGFVRDVAAMAIPRSSPAPVPVRIASVPMPGGTSEIQS